MKMPFLAGALCLAVATPAYACNFYFASSFMRLPAKPSFGVGVSGELGDATFWGISGDVAMKLGEKAVVQPGIGICTGEGETNPYFGTGVAYQISNNANMAVNLQSGISYETFDGGNMMIIPIGAAVSFKSGSNMSWYAGGSLWLMTASFDVDVPGVDNSVSDNTPVVFGGVALTSGPMAWTLGTQIALGDDTEFGIVLGANMNQAASAIRSFFRK